MCAICLCADRFGLRWAHDAICFACHMFMHFPCICTLLSILVIFELLGTFLIVFLSRPLVLFTLVMSMTPKHKSTSARNPLHSGASSSSDSAPLSLFGSVMMMPTRHSRSTFLNEAFIQNAKSFCRTLPTPTFPLSFTVGDGSHCVMSRSYVLLCLSRSFTPTCMGLIVQYLSFSLAFEIHAFLSHHN